MKTIKCLDCPELISTRGGPKRCIPCRNIHNKKQVDRKNRKSRLYDSDRPKSYWGTTGYIWAFLNEKTWRSRKRVNQGEEIFL